MATHLKKQDWLRFSQTHNLVPLLPLVIALLSGVGIFNALVNKVALTEQRMQYVENKTDTCLNVIQDIRNQVQSQKDDIIQLESRQAVKGASIAPKRILPTPTERVGQK